MRPNASPKPKDATSLVDVFEERFSLFIFISPNAKVMDDVKADKVSLSVSIYPVVGRAVREKVPQTQEKVFIIDSSRLCSTSVCSHRLSCRSDSSRSTAWPYTTSEDIPTSHVPVDLPASISEFL